MHAIHAKDHDAHPGGPDAAPGLQRALEAAARGPGRLVLDAGAYYLRSAPAAGLGAHLGLKATRPVEVVGAQHDDGTPATELVRHHAGGNDPALHAILRFVRVPGLTLCNLVLDNRPAFATAGRVIEAGRGAVTVEVFEGLPRADGMAFFCGNAWELPSRTLQRAPSLSFGGKSPLGQRFRAVGGPGDRRLQLHDAGVAAAVRPGDGVSWHAGSRANVQLLIEHCDHLVLDNLRTRSAAGFAMQTSFCDTIHARRIALRPDPPQLALGPRDGWKLHACRGAVEIDQLHIEGVRWDGQNVHGSFLAALAPPRGRELVLGLAYDDGVASVGGAAAEQALGGRLTFWDGAEPIDATPAEAEPIIFGGQDAIRVRFAHALPGFITTGTLVSVSAWDIARYTVRRSTFRNIAGSAICLRNSHALIEDCTFDRVMYPAVWAGCELTTWNEGTFPQDVTLRRCRFSASGWADKFGTAGMIGIGNQWTERPYIGTVRVEACRFERAEIGIHARALKRLDERENTFHAVDQPVLRGGPVVRAEPPAANEPGASIEP